MFKGLNSHLRQELKYACFEQLRGAMGDRGFDLLTLFVYFTQLLPSGRAFFG